jgi:hypothetical protein
MKPAAASHRKSVLSDHMRSSEKILIFAFWLAMTCWFTSPCAWPEEDFSSDISKVLLSVPGIKWKRGASEHFIYYYEKRQHFMSYSKKAESYYAKIRKDLSVKEASSEKCIAYLVPDQTHWEWFLSRIDKQAAGFCTGREIYIVCFKTGPYRDSEKTFAHEICHLIFMNFWTGTFCPLWLNEGFASYESGEVQRFPKRFSLAPGNLKRTDWIPLSELTAFQDYPENDEMNLLFYRQSEWLVKFLIEKHPPGLFRTFMKRLEADPTDFSKALLGTYGQSYRTLGEFEKAYRGFCRKQKGSY